MSIIRRIDPNLTRKTEFKAVFEEIIDITEKYNPDALHIGATFRKIKENAFLSEELVVAVRKSPLTKKIVKMRNERNNYISAINLQAKAQLKTNEPDKMAAAKLLLSSIKYILKRFSAQSYSTQAALISQFITEISNDGAKYQTLKTLGVETTFIKLKELEPKLKKTYFDRINETAGRKKMRTQQTKRTLYQMMCRLFTAVEAAQMEYPEIDYEPLIAELNQELTKQHTAYAKRLTRIHNQKQKEAGAAVIKE